jgi:hypothetical protein
VPLVLTLQTLHLTSKYIRIFHMILSINPYVPNSIHTLIFIKSTDFFCEVETEMLCITCMNGARGGAVVETLRYKPEGRRIDFRWCHWNFLST